MNYTIFQLAQAINQSDLDKTKLTPINVIIGAPSSSLSDILWKVVWALMDLAIYGFMVAVVIGGAQYIFSLGGDEGVAKAKKTFLNAIIGVFIVFFGHVILSNIAGKLGTVSDTFTLATAVGLVYQVVMEISGAGFLLILLFGGFRYLTAGGNDEAVTKARKQMLNAIIGIALVAFAYALGTELLELLKIIPKIIPKV